MRWIVYGAGAIGATIGARLHQSGADVMLIARGAHGARLAGDGLTFLDPDGQQQLQIPVCGHPNQLEPSGDDLILLCMKTQHTTSALDDLCGAGFAASPVVCVQNGVENERLALRRLPRVYGSVVNLPAQHLEPGVVATFAAAPGGGVLDTGCYPVGVDPLAETIAAGFRSAGFAAEADPNVMARKRTKLLINLGNALELLLATVDDRKAAARVLRDEGEAVFAAAGLGFTPLREFAERSRTEMRAGAVAGVDRVGGSTYQGLQRGHATSEIDYLNGEIVLLGRQHNLPAPVNAALLRLAHEVVRGDRAPRSMSWDALRANSQDVQ